MWLAIAVAVATDRSKRERTNVFDVHEASSKAKRLRWAQLLDVASIVLIIECVLSQILVKLYGPPTQ